MSPVKKTNILIVFKTNRIVIYSEETQELDVIDYERNKTEKGTEFMQYTCIDKEGKECIVKLFITDIPVLKVEYEDLWYAYQILKVE